MSDRQIRDLAPLPDGKTLRGFEVDFQTTREDWDLYTTSDGDIVKVRNLVLRVFRLVDDDDKPLFNPAGDPEYYVTTGMTVVASSGKRSKKK